MMSRWILSRSIVMYKALAVVISCIIVCRAAVGQTPAQSAALALAPAEPAVAAKVDDRPLAERVAERVKAFMEESGAVGVSVGLVKNGEVVYTGGWGCADREKQVPVTDETVYVWASCSKTMTAVVAMELWAEGKLDLDKDVREYVAPEHWLVKQWEGKDVAITARMLLGHQSGLPHSPPPPRDRAAVKYEVEHPYKDVMNCVDQFKDVELKSKPGTEFSYSNCGFILLGAVEQSVGGGKTYPELVHERIAVPLGLASLRPQATWDPAPHLAQGYAAGGKTESRLPSSDLRYGLPAGFWSSNVGDFAKYAAGLMGEKLLDAKMREAMWTNQKTADGKVTPVGLGIFVGGMKKGRVVLNHSGASAVTSTYMVVMPGEKVGDGVAAVVMCNTAGAKPGRLGNELVEMVGGGRVSGGGEEDVAH